mmetsp:Transcript_73931/g.213884  ORF Transcript_73931/g.213884 Transcript_73931/m.213884 type:complete len:262 (-) Transcript_73931:48-833(-)
MVLDGHVVRMLGVHLLLLALAELGPEVILQLFEKLDDSAGLELVRIGLRRLVVRAAERAVPAEHVDESCHQRARLLREAAVGDLEERGRSPRAVVVFFLHDGQRTVDGVDGLGVVLLLGEESLVVLRALVLLGLHVGLVLRLGLLVLHDLLAQVLDVAAELVDGGAEQLDAFAGLLDVLLEVRGLQLAPSLELAESDLLILFLLLGLGGHVLQHANDLLHRRDRARAAGGSGGMCHRGDQDKSDCTEGASRRRHRCRWALR